MYYAHQGVPTMVYIGCTIGWGIPRVYIGCISLGGVYLPVYTLPYPRWCIPPCMYPSLPHPGYTTILACYRSPYYTPGVLYGVYSDEALGSNLENSLGNEAKRVSQPPFL